MKGIAAILILIGISIFIIYAVSEADANEENDNKADIFGTISLIGLLLVFSGLILLLITR